jgi:hypothetical protein
MTAPGFWMNETSGVLRPVVERCINGADLSPQDIVIMRAYLRQWMEAPWQGPNVEQLRARIEQIVDRDTLGEWLYDAVGEGIDPL